MNSESRNKKCMNYQMRERERERERDFYGAVWQNDNMMRLDHDGEEF